MAVKSFVKSFHLVLLLLVAITATATPASAARMEEVKDRFNQVQSDYAQLKSYLDSGSIDSAKPAALKLNENAQKICNFTQDIKDRIAEIPSLQSTWKDVSYWCFELTARSIQLQDQLGKGSHNDHWSKVTEAFLKLGDSLKAGYDKFRDFGKNWLVICTDLCR